MVHRFTKTLYFDGLHIFSGGILFYEEKLRIHLFSNGQSMVFWILPGFFPASIYFEAETPYGRPHEQPRALARQQCRSYYTELNPIFYFGLHSERIFLRIIRAIQCTLSHSLYSRM